MRKAHRGKALVVDVIRDETKLVRLYFPSVNLAKEFLRAQGVSMSNEYLVGLDKDGATFSVGPITYDVQEDLR